MTTKQCSFTIELVYYKTYTGSSVPKSILIGMSTAKEILRHGHRVSWVIAGDGIKQKICEKTLPTDEAFIEWDDVIIEIIHNHREQLMIRLLKEYLEKKWT
jgi:hypothetical protein